MNGKTGMKKVAPVRKAHLNPRHSPMYGRQDGATMGEHLQEFNHFRDRCGRTFDQLVYCTLHGGTINLTSPSPKAQMDSVSPQKNKATMSQRLKMDAKKATTAQKNGIHFHSSQTLQNSYLSNTRKRMIPDVEHKRKRVEEGNEVKGGNEEVPDPEHHTTSRDKVVEIERKQKRFSVRRML
jgi:hypothetical protein